MNREIPVPKQITPCPIIESLVEYRFNSSVPSAAVLGVIYARLKNEFPGGIENLPILQLPETVRAQDPTLVNLPWYKIHQKDFFIQLGPKVLSFANTNQYLGWDSYFKKIAAYFKSINDTGVIESIHRIGLRYVNFFNFDIYDKTTVDIKINNGIVENKGLNIRVVIPSGGFLSNVSIVNNSELLLNTTRTFGSIIDIDTYIEKPFDLAEVLQTTERAHAEEKIIFYNLLKDDFVKTLKPVY